MLSRAALIAACPAALCLAGFAASILQAQTNPTASDAVAPGSSTELPSPFVPKQPVTEAEQDRAAATAHYVQARLLRHSDKDAEALQHYQRAWRYDPTQTSILSDIVPLAFQLQRGEEAARYAVIAAELDPKDAILLRRLAAYLAQQRQWERALKLYELALTAGSRRSTKGAVPDAADASLHLELGRLCFLTDRFEKSAEHFSKVRDALADAASSIGEDEKQKLLGRPESTYALWAESFLRAKRYDEAAAMFRNANEADPQPAKLAFNLARVEAGRNKADAAIASLDGYFQSKQTVAGTEPYELLGKLLRSKSTNVAEARSRLIARLKELRSADEANVPLVYSLADELFQSGQLAEAEKLYERAVTEQPTSEGYQRLVQIHRRNGEHQKLLTVAGGAAVETGSLAVLGDVGKSLAADAPLLKKLIDVTRTQKEEKPDSLAPGQSLAIALLALEGKQFDAAEEFFDDAAAGPKPPKSQVLLTWGMGLFAAEQPARAAKAFQRLVDENHKVGGEGGVHYLLAGALAMSDRTDDALRAIKRAMSAEPGNTRYEVRLGWILFHAKRYDEAKRAYQEMLTTYDADHKSPEIRQSLREVRLVLSNIALQMDDFPGAVEWLEQVLDEFPEDTSARNDLGYLWADRGEHLQRALRMTQEAVAAEPKNVAYRDSLGWAYYQLGRYDEALRELTIAAGGDEPHGVILDHLGDAYSKLKQSEKALAAWQRAATAFEKEGDAKRLAATKQKAAAMK